MITSYSVLKNTYWSNRGYLKYKVK